MAQPDVYAEDPDDEFDIETDLIVTIDNAEPGGGEHLSATAQEAVAVALIPANKKRSAARAILGYSYADDDAPYALHRELPVRHPVWPNLYAYAVSFSGLAPESNPENPAGETYVESPFEGSNGETMYYAGYQKAVATIRFKSWGRTRFLPDTDIDGYDSEYKRFVRFNYEPSVEALSSEGSSQLVFREGAGGTQPLADSTRFPSPIAELMAKAVFTLTWLHVPHNYLSSDPDILLLDHIVGRTSVDDTDSTRLYPGILGAVNDDAFLGFRKGTLLLRAVKAEEVLFPVATADPFDIAGGWTVTGVFEAFDPEKGVPASEYRGHRLFPSRFGKWWYANREGSEGELLPLRDFNAFFRHQADHD